mgnify:CR=1 FL=1
MHLDLIVNTVTKESVYFAQKEDVVNWLCDWMNHRTMIPELSGLVTETILQPTQACYVKFGDYDMHPIDGSFNGRYA